MRRVQGTCQPGRRTDRNLINLMKRPAWVLLSAVVFWLVIFAIPSWMTGELAASGAQRYQAMADIRTAVVAFLMAAGAAGGLAYTGRTFRLGQAGHLTGLFESASKQLGDTNVVVQLAGLHAMARLADEWDKQRQKCIDVLCAYLRVSGYLSLEELKHQREARRTAVDIMSEHLRPKRTATWIGYDFDLTGALLDVGDFRKVSFAGGNFLFRRARFVGEVRFDEAQFTGAVVDFSNARFQSDPASQSSCQVSFAHANFHEGEVKFEDAEFERGEVRFDHATFDAGCKVIFNGAHLGHDGTVTFEGATLTNGINFAGAHFLAGDGEVSFEGATFAGRVMFDNAQFHRDVRFNKTILSGGGLSFEEALLSEGHLNFDGAKCADGTFWLKGAKCGGGRINLSSAGSDPCYQDLATGSLVVLRRGPVDGSTLKLAS